MRTVLTFFAVLAFTTNTQAATISFTCNFSTVASLSGVKKESKPFEMRFISDTQTKKTYLVGNNGSSEVTAIQNQGGGVTFVETTDSGNVMVTAIATSGQAVHSRNGIMSGKIIPSQYYGNCLGQ